MQAEMKYAGWGAGGAPIGSPLKLLDKTGIQRKEILGAPSPGPKAKWLKVKGKSELGGPFCDFQRFSSLICIYKTRNIVPYNSRRGETGPPAPRPPKGLIIERIYNKNIYLALRAGVRGQVWGPAPRAKIQSNNVGKG